MAMRKLYLAPVGGELRIYTAKGNWMREIEIEAPVGGLCVCAWCGRVTGVMELPNEHDTHGICAACRESL